jgi:hypothetical protein
MLRITHHGATSEVWRSIKNSKHWGTIGEVEFIENQLIESDISLYFDHGDSKEKLSGKFNVLILVEPRTVNPIQYKKKHLNKFNLVIPTSPVRAASLGLEDYIYAPLHFIDPLDQITRRDLDFVILNANKFSSNSENLYALRRKISKYLYKNGFSYELYGLDWHMSKFKELRERIWSIRKELKCLRIPNFFAAFSEFTYRYPEYKGSPYNKQEVLCKFKYAVIIENEADYISEKIFDAIFSGCVPLYVGPSLNAYPILENCSFQIPGNMKDLKEFFSSNFTNGYSRKIEYINQINRNPDLLDNFSLQSNMDKLVEILINKIDRR